MEPTQTQEAPNFAAEYAANKVKGKENLYNALDKVMDAIAPLGNLGEYTKTFGRESKWTLKETGRALLESVSSLTSPAADRISKAVSEANQNMRDTFGAISQSGKEVGLAGMGLGEALVKNTVNGLPEVWNILVEFKAKRTAENAKKAYYKAMEVQEKSRGRAQELGKKRKEVGPWRAKFDALQVPAQA